MTEEICDGETVLLGDGEIVLLGLDPSIHAATTEPSLQVESGLSPSASKRAE